MTAAARAEGMIGEPGTLEPRALEAIEALFSAPKRTLPVWRITRVVGGPGGLLMDDMAALGLVERVGRINGSATRWRLLVEGPAYRPIEQRRSS